PPDVICADCVEALRAAVHLYNRDFLTGFTLRDCPEFDEWQFFQAESLRQELAAALERLVEGYSRHNQPELAIPHARRWVALDSLNEPAQRALIHLYDQAGQPAAALRQYEEYVDLLEKELGLPPEEETTTTYEAIKAKRMLGPYLKEKTVDAKSSIPEPPKRRTPFSNLPIPPTDFIGRQTELAEIRRLVAEESNCRMLTLVGPGGIGKTRLVIESGRQLLDLFAHGVCFVALAPVSNAEFIIPAMADALNLTFTNTASPKNQLLTYLHDKQMLLLLDNFEHVLDGADVLADILHAAPQVKLLVTSRERLNLQEEWVHEIWGMSFPEDVQDALQAGGSALEQYSAIQLFVQRARRTKTNMIFSSTDIPALVRICALVDGMPLGLELAAPWVRLMSCQEIAAELEQNIDLLTTTLHNVPDRHRSLRAVFEQTWARLLPGEQTVLSRISVFRGGCLREAAEAVTEATLPLLLSLVDKALVRRSPNGRYEMHELVRQFAHEQLQANPDEVRQTLYRHYGYYADFLQQQNEALKGDRQKEALEAISADIDNVRAAWQRAIEQKDATALDQAAEALCLYSEMRGALDEGEMAFHRAAEAFAAETQTNSVRGFLLVGQGMLRTHRGELQDGQNLLEQGLSLLEAGQSPKSLVAKRAFALMWLGWALFLQGKNVEAEQIVQESLALTKNNGDRWGQAKNLFILGNSLTARGLLAESEPLLRESLRLCQAIHDRRSCLLVNRNLAILTFWFGDYAQTARLLDAAATLSREFDDHIGLAYALRELGKLEVAEGKVEQAIQTLKQSIAITDEIGSQWESAATRDDLGMAYLASGDVAAAEQALNQCLGAAQALNNRYYTARCWGDLGYVAYRRGDYQQAERYLRRALDLWAEIGHEPYSAWVLSYLGHVANATGGNRQTEAARYWMQALQLAITHKLAPFALDIFVGVAKFLAESDNHDLIAKLLILSYHHDAGTYETKEQARHMLNSMVIPIPSKDEAQIHDWQAAAGEVIERLAQSQRI
ncbi:MAG: tetratricopeptide repeat protein, partial [Anaerolineae bacterium]|nr:tetratricopeptide repeat protein [Anaerolineae bacterium]